MRKPTEKMNKLIEKMVIVFSNTWDSYKEPKGIRENFKDAHVFIGENLEKYKGILQDNFEESTDMNYEFGFDREY